MIILAWKKMEGRWGLIVITIIVAIFIKYAMKLLDFLWFKPKKLENFLRSQGIGGNPYVPFLGDIKDYMRCNEEEEATTLQLSDDLIPHIYPYCTRLISKHGPNAFHWFGPCPWFNITDPEMMKEILRNNDVFDKGLTGPTKILAAGLSSHEGQKWAKHRKIINPAFHLDRLKNKVGVMESCCCEMIRKWKNIVSSDSNEIDVWPFLEELTEDVISKTAFGSNSEEGRTVFHLQSEKIKIVYQLLPLFFIPGWRFLPLQANRKVKAMTKEIESTLRHVIGKREKEIESRERHDGDDLLGILLESNKRYIEEEGNNINAGMSIEDVMEECQLFYFAGVKTTASLLAWTMLLLGTNPEWQTRAREEVVRVFGSSNITFEAVNRLKVVNMILQEVLRLYPPASITLRRAKDTAKIGNITVPAGSYLSIYAALIHYDSDIWGDDAKDFNPQRFSEGVSKAATNQSSFISFGLGPRNCIGQNFAMIEAKIVIAMILRSFKFELSPTYEHAPFGLVHLKPQRGLQLIFHNL